MQVLGLLFRLPFLVGALLLLVGLVQASEEVGSCRTWLVWEVTSKLKANPYEIWVYIEDRHGSPKYGNEPMTKLTIGESQTEEWFDCCHPERISKIVFHFPKGPGIPRGYGLELTIPMDYRFKSGCNRKYEFTIDLDANGIGFDYYPQKAFQQ